MSSPVSSHGHTFVQRRAAIGERLLTALEALVQRHRVLALHTEHLGTHADLIAAEVALELSAARTALQRVPGQPAGAAPPQRNTAGN